MNILKKIGGPTNLKPGQRFERKFAIIPTNLDLAYAFLRQLCRPDREYPVDRVTSLYFDTRDLDQYQKSESGEFRKNKVRIRWYGSDMKKGATEIPFYLEIKQREGFASSKLRRKFLVPISFIKPVQEGILNKTTITQTLASLGYFPEKPLRPVIVISYRRYRFSEIQTGVRVSFDRDIRASIVATDLGRQSGGIRLENGVIEVKGPSIDLPITLRRLRFLDIDWSRFSKYGNCLDAYFSQSGDIY
ncbi:MAG: VTC domain-containing protein [Dehalococcoidales bacterium]|nr:VTC domain-containing protein [Dehalococcoidales bacterium]